jgi:hypothetical protein
MASPPNPYFIYIELVWPDGHRATQNEIARVVAWDVNGTVVTNEGQSGFNPNTGGWQPVFMQNIAAFASRGAPNLRFDVVSTSEQVVFTTQIFNNIPSGSTVHIVIGQSATLIGGGPTLFTLTGHAHRASDGSGFFPGTIQAFDVTNGSAAALGSTVLATDGSYSVSFTSSAFSSNGSPHVQPNVQVQLLDPATGQLLTESQVVMGWVSGQMIDLVVDDSVPSGQEHRVFGTVTNGLGLPVSGIVLQAVDVVWTTTGIQQLSLGFGVSDGAGNYSIVYQPPNPTASPNACGPAPGSINLLVYALTVSSPPGSPPGSPPASPPAGTTLATAGVFFNAANEQRADIVVNKTAVSTDSEYTRLNNAISACLGATDADRFNTLNQLNAQPALLTFVADSSGQSEALIRAYVQAWLIAGDIAAKVFSPPSSPPGSPPASPPSPFLFQLVFPLSAEVMYGLVRDALGVSLSDLLSVEPDAFFDAIVEAIHQGIISASIEAKLRPSSATAKDSLVDDWRTVLAVMLTRTPGAGEAPQWQQQLLRLAIPDTPSSPAVTGPATVSQFSTDTAQAHNVHMPSQVAAGDLLIAILTIHSNAFVAVPSGWAAVGSGANGTTLGLSAFYKVAAGSEGGTSVNFTNVGANGASQVFCIAAGTWTSGILAVNISFATSTGSSTSVAPPPANLNLIGSSPPGDLFVAVGAYVGAANLSASPPNYGSTVRTNSGLATAANSVTLLSAQRVNLTNAEQPGPFTLATSSVWVAGTIAISPGALSQASKRQAVASAHFDTQGDFEDLLTLLQQNPIFSALDLENLRFVFEMYDRVSRYYPIVASVFASKATRGWHTIADLATVSLSDWIAFALASTNFTGPFPPPTGFPGDVPGNNANDRAAVYGQRLFDLFGGASPQNRFVAAFTQSPPNSGLQQIAQFLQENPSFKLESSNIDVFNAAALGSPPASPPITPLPASLVPQMKQLQRVYRLTDDFAAAQALVTNGFDSAVKISQVEEGAFIASQEQFVGGLTAARNIHRTASHYTNEVLLNVVRFHQNLNDVGGLTAAGAAPNFARAAALFNPSTFTTVDPTEGFIPNLGGLSNQFPPDPRKLPDWTTLFGNLNACACQCCQTVLSPGAYLVDIIEFATQGPENPLLDRRFDLKDIEITCSNTNTELPYIDLVNETLEGAITPPSFQLIASPPISAAVIDGAVGQAAGNADYDAVAQAFQAAGAPLGPRATIRTAVDDAPAARVWTLSDDAAVYSIRGAGAPFRVYPSLVAPRAFALAEISKSPPSSIPAATLDAAVAAGGPITDPDIRAAFQDHGYLLGEAATIRKSAEDKSATVSGAARVWIVEDEAWQFTIRGLRPPFITFPAPQTSSTNDTLAVFPDHVTTAAYDILSNAVFPFNLPLSLGKEQANIFLQAKGVRPHEVLEAFTIDDRDAVLQNGNGALAFLNLSSSEAAAILAAPSGGPQYWGFDTTGVVSIVRPDQPTQTLSGTWLDLLTLVPVFLHRSGLAYQELLDLLDTAFVQQEAPAGKVFHISATGDALAECDFNQFQIAHLNDPAAGPPTLRRMSFSIRLWRSLGWTMRDLDTYLMSLEGGVIPGNFTQLFLVKRLADQLQLDAREVFAFWSDLDTRRTDRNKRSFFDEIFLIGTPGQPELVDLEQVARGNAVPLAGTAPASAGEDLRAHVRAGLRLKAAEIDLLWPTTGSLTVSTLSQIYRIATFSHAIGISVVDYFDLVALTGNDPFPAPPASPPIALATQIVAAFDAIADSARARSTNMSVAEIEYYLTDFSKAGDKFVPKREDLNAAAQRLALSVAEIATALPDLPNPDATALSQLLAKVVPKDKVVRAVTIVTPVFPPSSPASPPDSPPAGPPAPPSSDDLNFLKRYFAPFIADGPDAFLTALFDESDGPTRFKIVFDKLNAYLVDQTKTSTVLSATSELFGTDRDTVDILLTQSLSSTHGRATALDDWKAILAGGWDTGDPTIENLDAGSPLSRTWNGVIVVPRGGAYRFVVSIAAAGASAADFTLTIDDGTPATAGLPKNPVAQAPGSPPSGTVFAFDPVTLKGGAVLDVSLTYRGLSQVSLLWQIDNADPVVVPAIVVLPITISAPLKAAATNASPPAAQLPPVQPSEYLKLFKAARMIAGLSLTKAELRYLIGTQSLPTSPPDPQALAFSFDLLPVRATEAGIPWAALAAVIDLLGLNRSLAFRSKTLFELWNDIPTPASDDVANQTGWKPEDIAAVQSLWTMAASPPASPPPPTPSFRDPKIWYVSRAVMDIVNRLDLRAQRILDLLVVSEPTAESVIALRNAFRSQFSKSELNDVFTPLMAPLRQRQRDALVGYLTTRPVLYNGKLNSFFDANDLYAFFLIDVQMEADTLISRIVLAHLVVQLFVDRVFLGLESPLSFSDIESAKDQWAWMQRFRVWEANRRVFLYPENYIEPELRDDKTELFQELEDELLQSTISDDVGNNALANYLDKMNEVSNLEIIGSYAEGGAAGTNYVLHVIARTRFEPRTVYYRTFLAKQASEGTWTPWKKIPIDIRADVVAPVIFNGHLHLFWPSIIVKQRANPPKDNKGNPQFIDGHNIADENTRVTYVAEIKLMSTEYVPSQNKWLKPKVSKNRSIDRDAPTPFTNEVGEALPRTDNYHLRVSDVGKEYVSVELYKTHTPVPATANDPFFGSGTAVVPRTTVLISGDGIVPAVLATFRFWYTGDDTIEVPGDPIEAITPLNKNWPVNTALIHNGAVQVDFEVEGQKVQDELELKDNVAFFQRTPYPFRVFDTNFGYVTEENLPFFYETSRESLFAVNKGLVTEAGFTSKKVLAASFATFNHPLVRQLQQIRHDFGTAALMNRLTEALPLVDDRYYANYYYNYYGHLYLGYHIAGDNQALGTIGRLFEAEFDPRTDSVVGAAARPTVEFGYGSPFGVYNWELFFHLPMLIAERLKQDLQFEDALKWYHYVFDPKQSLNTYEETKLFVSALPVGARFWTFLPFFANKDVTDSLLDTLGLTKTLSADQRVQLANVIDDWRHNPFKPDLIARQRIASYQKFVVMKYLDNLIKWADTLFIQDSFESINQATQLYVLCSDILRDKPQDIDSLAKPQQLTFRELAALGLDAFSDAIVEVEYQIVTNQDYLKNNVLEPQNSAAAPIRSIALRSFFFMIPRNDLLDGFWDTVADRLFKIRNSMNIDGVKRQLALFQPPINPALLVAAAAAGLDLSSVVAQLNAPLPHYRFNVWMQKAVDLCNELKAFGAELLSALEKKDGEALQLLRQGHEITMLQLARKVRAQQVDEEEGNIAVLEGQRDVVKDRHDNYQRRVKINDSESQEVTQTSDAGDKDNQAGWAHTLAALFAPIPDGTGGMVGPLPSEIIEFKIGSYLENAANATGQFLGREASSSRNSATLAGLQAGFDRRWDDFQLELSQTTKELTHIDQQLAVARIRRAIAEQELENQDTQIGQSKDVLDFLQSKFSNKDLYSFLVTQLSRTFQQVYQLAFDAAKTAERTFQFELGVDDTFIQFSYQDSLHQGLLAGEKLIQDLKRMEVGYLQRYKREYEIQKPISLAVLNGQALQDLRENGSCTFELPEILFDLDFPGQYFRRVKSVRLTIPCVTGPHTSVSAKLTLLGSAYRKDAKVPSAAKYPYTGPDDPRFVQDPVGIQAIATSSGQNDAGLFELNFRDERYLPFEGAGVISRWRLELPSVSRQFDYQTISDVVVQLGYTAREGGGQLKTAAEAAINDRLNTILSILSDTETGLVRAFSLRREFPDVLHKLLATPLGSPPPPLVAMNIEPEHFPFVIRQRQIAMTAQSVTVRIDPKVGRKVASGAAVAVFADDSQTPLAGADLVPGFVSQDLFLQQASTPLVLDDVDDIVVIVSYTVDKPKA